MQLQVKRAEWIFLGTVFLGMAIFFTQAHPFIPFDGDDWKDLAELRTVAFPKWHDWNPIKVLPETFSGLTGYLGAYIFAPILGDYLNGISMAVAFVLALFITVYVGLFEQMLRQRFHMTVYPAVMLAGMFLLLHFLVFKGAPNDNTYLFATNNLNCVFHYIIPYLWNASLVLGFITFDVRGDTIGALPAAQAGGVIFLLFLGIFSNLFFSIVLITYVMWRLGCNFLSEKQLIKSFLRENVLYIGVLVAWLVSLLFEANGGRSGSGVAGFVSLPIMNTAGDFLELFLQKNNGLTTVMVLAVFFAGSAVVSLWRQRSEEGNVYRHMLQFAVFGLIFWLAFQIPVCAKVNPQYIQRSDVLAGWFFFLFLLILVSLGYWLQRKKWMMMVLPILFFAMFCRTVNGHATYIPSNIHHLPEYTCQMITRDFMGQFLAAEHAHADVVELHVPKYSTEDNWPQFESFGKRMERTLYTHGVITRHFEVHMVIDASMNEKYNIRP